MAIFGWGRRIWYRVHVPVPCDYEDFSTLSRLEKIAYMRLACWPDRCLCGEYGLPWPALRSVRDDTAFHERARCQPSRERIP